MSMSNFINLLVTQFQCVRTNYADNLIISFQTFLAPVTFGNRLTHLSGDVACSLFLYEMGCLLKQCPFWRSMGCVKIHIYI